MSVVNITSGQSYSTLSAAIAASSANDVIQISAGTYVENFPNITHNLTIESVGGTAYLSNPQPDPPNGRAVLNVPGNLDVNLTVSGLDISGAVDDASDPSSIGGANGAGILFESGNGALVVENCSIHGNEDGILTGAANAYSVNGMTVTITGSDIYDNGVPSTSSRFGYDHDIYIGAVTQFTISDSYVHDALGGHEIKSRALASTIENNVIADGNAPASYEIDLSDGGTDIVTGNIIEKGPNSPQEHAVDFGAEGTYAGSSLIFSDNTIIADDPSLGSGVIGLLNATLDPSTGKIDSATIANDTFYGITSVSQDLYGPPGDTVTGARFLPLAGAPVSFASLTSGADTVSGGGGLTIVLAQSGQLSAGDSINAGSNPANMLVLQGAGAFNLSTPASMAGIETVTAREGQAAYAAAGVDDASEVQSIVLRAGMNAAVDVSAAAIVAGNPNAATITITGAANSAVIDLASGNDVVTMGAGETLNGGSGNDTIVVTAATIGDVINGGSGHSTLQFGGGGAVTLGGTVSNIAVFQLKAAATAYDAVANSIPGLTVLDSDTANADTIQAGGIHQILTGGGAGKLTMIGASDTDFADTKALFNHDTIENLAAGDSIDLTNLGFTAAGTGAGQTNLTFAGGTLSVLLGGAVQTAISMSGTDASRFSIGPDGGAGTMLTYHT